MNFDDLFKQPIPLNEASDFFLKLTKTAEWTDPPDMTGELEGQFNASVEEVLAKLREVITAKFRLMVGYYTYAQSFRGPWWRAAKIEYFDHAQEEAEGAEYYLKRAVALGGPVHMDPIDPPPASNNPVGILKMMLRAEQEMIYLQRELLELVGQDNPMRVGIEEQMSHDQHHLDETLQMLTQEQHQQVEGTMPDEEMPLEPPMEEPMEEAPELEEEEDLEEDEEPEEEEAPLEEKAAAMRLALALEKEAVSKEWIAKRVQSGVNKIPVKDLGGRLERFGGKMSGMAQRSAAKGEALNETLGAAAKRAKGAANRGDFDAAEHAVDVGMKVKSRMDHNIGMVHKAKAAIDSAGDAVKSRAAKAEQAASNVAREVLQQRRKDQLGRGLAAGAGMAAAGAAAYGAKKRHDKHKAKKEGEEKQANVAAIPALAAGLSTGRNLAGNTAAALAPEGRVTRSDQVARQAAYVGAPVGGVAGMIAAERYGLGNMAANAAHSLGAPSLAPAARFLTPAAAALGGSALGGVGTGALVGGVQALRGSPKGYGKNTKAERAKKEKSKERESEKSAFKMPTYNVRSLEEEEAAAKRAPLIGAVGGGLGGLATGLADKGFNRQGFAAGAIPALLVGTGGALGGYVGGKMRLNRVREMEEEKQDKEAAYVTPSSVDSPIDPYAAARLKGKGEERAITGLAAEAKREMGRRGERAGKTVGMLAGGAGGAALGKKYVGGPVGTLGGAALGALMGRSTGGELGTEADIRRNRSKMHVPGSQDQRAVEAFLEQQQGQDAAPLQDSKGRVRGYKVAAMRFKLATMKLGFGEDPGEMAAPAGMETEPTNYLAAEIMGRQAQEANEANFYKQQLDQTRMEMQGLQQEAQQARMQLDQLQQQSNEVGAQVQQAAQEAIAARDEAVMSTMEAAKARIGAQKMRQMFLEIASQDPAMLGEEALSPQPGDPMMGAPDAALGDPAMEGPAGMAPPQEGMPPPEGAGAPEEAAATPKVGSASPMIGGALVGGALGAYGGYSLGKKAPGLRDKVQQLEGAQDGTFRRASALAAAKQGLAASELSERHPVGSALTGGLSGAMAGLKAGPGLAGSLNELKEHGKVLGRALQR